MPLIELCPACECPLIVDQSWISSHSLRQVELAHCPNCDGRYWHYAGEAWINRYANILNNKTEC